MRRITIELDDDRFDNIAPDEASNMIKHQIRHSEWDINQKWFLNLTVRVESNEKERNNLYIPSTEEIRITMNKEMEGIDIYTSK